MERSLFDLLPRLPLRLWLGEDAIERGRDCEFGELTDRYNALPDLEGPLADDMDLLRRAAAILSLNSSACIVVGLADRASAAAWTGTCLYGTFGFGCSWAAAVAFLCSSAAPFAFLSLEKNGIGPSC
jgi:uncharacterized membrane protein YphA (DoxX/SURF4 family)